MFTVCLHRSIYSVGSITNLKPFQHSIYHVIYWQFIWKKTQPRTYKVKQTNNLISALVHDQYKLNPNKWTHFVPSFSSNKFCKCTANEHRNHGIPILEFYLLLVGYYVMNEMGIGKMNTLHFSYKNSVEMT